MDVNKSSFPDSINPNNFPAKLWRLVNDPANQAISWDSLGQAVVINRHLFETQILSPGSSTLDNPDTFKMTHFSSFIRQLNLYGFNKVPRAVKSDNIDGCHCFYNPNFKQNQPQLVSSLKRLTANNKAKIEAGLDVKSRTPRRHLRFSGGEGGVDIKVEALSLSRSSQPSPRHEQLTHPYYPSQAHAVAVHPGTPLPPRFLTRGYSTALTPAILATDQGMPGSSSYPYAGVASSSSATHIQQALLAPASLGNPNLSYAQYQPGFYSSYCHSNLVAAHMAGSGLQAGLFSPCTYHQAGYLMNTLCYTDHDSKNQEKKYDINLDNIFQMADEVMQPPAPCSRLVQVVTPEKPGPVVVPSSTNTGLRDSPAKAKPSLYPIITCVTGKADLVALKQLEESTVSPPEKIPEDAIIKVTTDGAKNTEVKDEA